MCYGYQDLQSCKPVLGFYVLMRFAWVSRCLLSFCHLMMLCFKEDKHPAGTAEGPT